MEIDGSQDQQVYELRGWTDLSGRQGYSTSCQNGTACSVSVNERSQGMQYLAGIKIDIIATTGLVRETICTESHAADTPAILGARSTHRPARQQQLTPDT
ncbi:hypothetical protein ABZ137_07845 [Streptomyces bobili]|uniref:hypothetical protein n=1 Tax=Streptomyces bobili TaxID=67280 RepID=UPI0033AFB86C